MKPKITKIATNIFDEIHKPFIISGSHFGIRANHITFLQLPFIGIMFYGLLANDILNIATFSLLISLYLDLLDGAWARIKKEISRTGYIYDKILDLIGIVAFLAGIYIIVPELRLFVLALLIINFIIYASNIFWKPELYCGVRSFGLFGLIFYSLIEVFIIIPLILCIGMIIYKIWVNYVKS